MPTHDEASGSEGGLIARIRRRTTRHPPADDCSHPHARERRDDAGELATVLVCERCGAPLDASDPTLRRSQRLGESRFCIDCGGTHWTTGARRTV
jgi:hypothetical protein